VDLAHRFKNLKFIVQDLPKTISSAPTLPWEIADRITFQAHGFYTEQPVKGADVYLFHWIVHSNSDKHATQLMRALIPALERVRGCWFMITVCWSRDGRVFGMRGSFERWIS
jgi:hypothetical protein